MTALARGRSNETDALRARVGRIAVDPAAHWPAHGLRLNFWDVATVSVIVTLLVLVALTFRSYAVSNDEWVQQHYGHLIVNYYRSGFADRSLFTFENLYLYGGLFDVLADILHNVVPLEIYDLRHLMTALIGIGGVAAAAMLARHIAGPRAGFLAAAGLAVCGAWYGTMFTHTKDIPLAASMTAASYFLIRASRDLPRPRWRDVIGFGLMTGCALGIKVLGLLLVVYAGLVVIASFPQISPLSTTGAIGFVLRCCGRFVPAFLLAYAIMIAAWPWAALSPLNPVRGLFQFADFHYHIQTVLAGQSYEMATVPRLYVPIYLAIRTPLLLLGAAFLSLLLVLMPRWSGRGFPHMRRRETTYVIVMVVFPLACQVIGHGPAFTGMRHFLFVLPMIAVLAGIGADSFLALMTRRHWLLAAGAFTAIIADLSWNAHVLYELHPYEYLYYNSSVGGLAGASRRYVTDYWVAVMPAAVRQLDSFLKQTEADKQVPIVYTVAVCGERSSFERELRVQHLRGELRWTNDWPHADFFIAPTHRDCDRALDGQTIATTERLGTLIGVVKDRRRLTRPAIVQIHRSS